MMDDLISRQKVLTFIEKSVSEYGDRYSVDMLNMWGLFAQVVKDMPQAQQWIPCSERLPEKKGDYLVTDDSGGAAWVEKAWFMRCDDGSAFWEYANVTAWMPLPEPYREETES